MRCSFRAFLILFLICWNQTRLAGVWFRSDAKKYSSTDKAQRANSVQTGDKNDRESFIDKNLKRVFDEALDEGVPDRFKDLLEQLKKQDAERDKSR
jgi:hypothetical protein